MLEFKESLALTNSSEEYTPDRLVEALFRFEAAFDRMTSQIRHVMRINAHERLALQLLWDMGPMSMGDLGDRIPLSRAAITALVDRLVEAGYVERHMDKKDRRRSLVSATERGTIHIKPLMAPWARRVHELHEQFGEDAERALEYMERIRELNDEWATQLAAMSESEMSALLDAPVGS